MSNGRLLTDKELDNVRFDMGSPWGVPDRRTVGKAIMEAQDAKTAEIVRAEERERILSMIWVVQSGVGRGSGRVSKANLEALKQGRMPDEKHNS